MSDTSPELEKLRGEIDEVDSGIVALLKKRSDIVERVKVVKQEAGIDAHQPERFAKMLIDLKQKAKELGVDEDLVVEVWNAIHHSSLRQQDSPMAVPELD